MLIRQERPSDEGEVRDVVRAAFGAAQDVTRLVDDLRASLAAEPGLSLVAVDDQETVVGHVMSTRSLLDARLRLVDVQVLSPLAVTPGAQRRGIGGALVRELLRLLVDADVPAVFLEGSPAYYSRFGFRPGHEHGFRRPSLRIPRAAFQVRLLPAHSPWMTGTLVYRHEFWDHDAVGLRGADLEEFD